MVYQVVNVAATFTFSLLAFEASRVLRKPLHEDVGGITHAKNEEEVRKHANTYYAPGKTRSTPAKGIAYS
jgi:hypothetical protein